QIPEEDFDSAWYECESEPLKWHYPVGLLYDLEYQNITLPWSLTIRFKNFPSSTLLAKPTPTTMQNMYMSMIKEAEFLRTGNTKKVMNLSKHDQIQLWQSLSLDCYDDYWKVNKQLTEYSLSNRHVPVRLYLPDNCPVVQELVSFHQENSGKRRKKRRKRKSQLCREREPSYCC
ncbi:autophagy protein Apg5-domain-containing protein, partial [Sporodiniella umbellata]